MALVRVQRSVDQIYDGAEYLLALQEDDLGFIDSTTLNAALIALLKVSDRLAKRNKDSKAA